MRKQRSERIAVWKMVNVLKTWAAIALIFVAFALVAGVNVCRFSAVEGERTFYLDSASSQGLRKQTLCFSDIFRIRGESVRFPTNGLSAEEIANKIAEEYDAEILLREEVCGVISFYAYTESWSDYVLVEGQKINLHIAVNADMGTLGSPIIFDGY